MKMNVLLSSSVGFYGLPQQNKSFSCDVQVPLGAFGRTSTQPGDSAISVCRFAPCHSKVRRRLYIDPSIYHKPMHMLLQKSISGNS
jgi:hypothetical protein